MVYVIVYTDSERFGSFKDKSGIFSLTLNLSRTERTPDSNNVEEINTSKVEIRQRLNRLFRD